MATPDFPSIPETERPIPPFLESGWRWNGETWERDPGAGAPGAPVSLPGITNPAQIASTATGAGGTVGATAAAGGVTAASLSDLLKKAMADPKNWASMAALIPLLTNGGGGGNNLFNDPALAGEVKDTLALQRKRMEQAQPVYDTLVNMSYGMSPTRYRGPQAPAGYTPNAPPEGAYDYKGPRFG